MWLNKEKSVGINKYGFWKVDFKNMILTPGRIASGIVVFGLALMVTEWMIK